MLLLISQFIALFSLVALGFYVFAVDPRRRANQAFAAFNGLLAFWTVRDILFWNFEEFRHFEEAWLITGLVSAVLMMISLVAFSEDFPTGKPRLPRPSLAVIAPSILLIPACIGGFLWTEFDLSAANPKLELTASGYFFAGYISLLFLWGTVNLGLRLRAEGDGQTRKQLATVLTGLALTAILMFVPTVILPLTGDVSWLPISSVFAIPGVVLNGFAILNFRLFSLQSVLDEVRHFPIAHKVAFSVAAVAVSSFIFLQLPIVWWSFRNGAGEDAWARFITFSLIAALVPNLILVLAVVRTVSRPIKRLTVTALETSKGRYGLEVDGRTTNDEIGILTSVFNRMSRKMANDLATLQRMNDRLMRTEKLASIGTLSAGIAHEISNPLSAVISLVETLRKRSETDPESARQLEIITKQLERVSVITREMLDFAASKPEHRTPADVNEIVTSSLRLVGFDTSFRSVKLEVALESGIPRVECDPDQIQQVLVNLLLNARQAIDDDGEISVVTARRSGEIVVEVRDNGCGINEEYISCIFDPFFTTKGDQGGTGLGLAVSYGIMKGHGGRLEALPNSPKGTVLRVLLPINSQE